jgi:flagellar protein FlaJ
VEWSIPIHKALHNFAKETKNEVIKRSISTVIEAEMSGGNIEDVLETVTNSVIEIKTIKLERKASIHSQLVQSYVIFLVFLGVMVIIQNMLIPYIANIEAQGAATDGAFAMPSSATGSALKTVEIDYSSISGFIISMSAWLSSIKGVFLMLAVIQAFFAGLVLGKLSEGDMISGLKHSLILMTVSFFIISLAQGIVGVRL